MRIEQRIINRKNLLKNYIETENRHYGIQEMMSYYSRFGMLNKFRIGLPSISDMGLCIMNGMNYNVDYILNKMAKTGTNRLSISDSIFSGGKGMTIADCMAAALGESFERIIGSFVFFGNYEKKYGTYNELSKKYNLLNPEEYSVFSEEAYFDSNNCFNRFDKETKLVWIKLINSEDKSRELWVPAQFIFLLYVGKKDEKLIGYASSGGLSCHNSIEEALEHGKMELIERDSINVCWNCHLPPKQIVIDSDIKNVDLKNLIQRENAHLNDVKLYLHPINDVYVVTAIKKDKSLNKYYFLAGGGVSEEIDKAIIGALTEYIQAENNLKGLIYSPKWRTAEGIKFLFDVPEDVPTEDLKLFYQIIPYYGYDKNFKKLKWYLEDGEKNNYSECSRKEINNELKNEFFYIDLTPEQFKHIKLVKVFNKNLTPAYIASMPMQGHKKYSKYCSGNLVVDPIPFP